MLRIENVRKVFNAGTMDEKAAIDGISLSLEKGDFVTIIGSNGAGKTTLLNLVAGTCLPDTGNICIDEENVTQMPEHKRAKFLGRIFQNP
jgi:putative ABC transport system ATP-binding protein